MRISGLLSFAAGVVVLVVGEGCSFAFVESVPDNPERLPYFDCTSTLGLPVADGVFALGGAVTGALTLTQSKQEFEDENDGASRDLAAGVDIGFAVAMVASGIYGMVKTGECRSAKRELEARLMPESKHRPIEPAVAAPPPPAAAPPAPALQPAAPAPEIPQDAVAPPAAPPPTPEPAPQPAPQPAP